MGMTDSVTITLSPNEAYELVELLFDREQLIRRDAAQLKNPAMKESWEFQADKIKSLRGRILDIQFPEYAKPASETCEKPKGSK